MDQWFQFWLYYYCHIARHRHLTHPISIWDVVKYFYYVYLKLNLYWVDVEKGFLDALLS